MDNITHSLIGIAAAETLVIGRKKARIPLWIASAAANNLPDLDVLLTWGRSGDKLDYLLQHRGYTHTLLLAPLQGLIFFLLFWLFGKKRPGLPWKEIAFLCMLGPLLHIFADSWNSYGVHPFWPWENRWFYGDFVFIIEPWIWVALAPLCWARSSSRVGKGISLLLLAFTVGVVWYTDRVQPYAAVAISFGAVLWAGAQLKICSDALRLFGAFAIIAFAFGAFGFSTSLIRREFSAPGREVAVLTHPANPFCATVLTAEITGADYVATGWTISTWPRLIPASKCPAYFREKNSANLQPLANAAPTDQRIPLGEFRAPASELASFTNSCRARAFLRFARIPIWFTVDGQRFVGDLRFARDRALSFAEAPVDGPAADCPRFEPPWIGRFFPGT